MHILNLTVSANKHNPLRARCHIKLPREIMLKRAVMQTADNVCFVWSIATALHSAQGMHIENPRIRIIHRF